MTRVTRLVSRELLFSKDSSPLLNEERSKRELGGRKSDEGNVIKLSLAVLSDSQPIEYYPRVSGPVCHRTLARSAFLRLSLRPSPAEQLEYSMW
jgi:hypothetical protein